MKKLISVLVSAVFLLQTFATAIAMPVNQISYTIEKVANHSCCKTTTTTHNKSKSESQKGTCTGDAKMSCCTIVFSLEPISLDYDLVFIEFIEKVKIPVKGLESNFISSFFHPPQIA